MCGESVIDPTATGAWLIENSGNCRMRLAIVLPQDERSRLDLEEFDQIEQGPAPIHTVSLAHAAVLASCERGKCTTTSIENKFVACDSDQSVSSVQCYNACSAFGGDEFVITRRLVGGG